MAIGINDYSALLRNYRVPEIPYVGGPGKVTPQAPQTEAKQEAPVRQEEDVRIYERAKIREPELEDISLTFNKSEEFGFLGKDSSLSLLDLDAQIPEVQKDQILQQYQFFAGSGSGTLVDNADGMVTVKAL